MSEAENKKPDPKDLVRRYYQSSLHYLKESEKAQERMLAVGETMGWTPEEMNEILGSQVIAPAPKPEEAKGG